MSVSRAMRANKNGSGPSIFRFTTRLLENPNKTKSAPPILLLSVPPVVSRRLPAHGTTVEGTINGHPFRAALAPDKSGRHLLPVNKAMRAGADAGVGDTVQLAVLVPEAEPAVPADLRASLETSKSAKAFWKSLTYMNRHDWIRWINSAKKSETRSSRIALAVKWLSSGKRQPCCFNTYEYMLSQVYANGDRPKNAYPKSARRAACES